MDNKKTLCVMTYYTLIGMMVAFAVFFGVFLWMSSTPTFAQVLYTIWLVLIVCAIIFDIIGINANSMRGTIGYVLYVISVVTVIASFIVYGVMSNNGALIGDELSLFTILLALSYGINVLAIIIYAMGNTFSLKHISKTR